MKKIIFIILSILYSFLLNANTYTVINTNDTGAGSLRRAINDANANAGTDNIIFNIPGPAPHVINPVASLNSLDDGFTIIDATTQPLNGGTDYPIKRIELSGPGGTTKGFTINSTYCEIYGFYIHGFQDGITLIGDFWEGYTVGGTGNKGNVISGNTRYGFSVHTGDLTHEKGIITNNYIGVSQDGTGVEGNGAEGIYINSSNNNFTTITDNVVSNNGGGGIKFGWTNQSDHTISNNYIGTDATGTVAMGNTGDGIYIGQASHRITISNNLIADNTGNGISFKLTNYLNIVDNNKFGIDVTGLVALGSPMTSGLLLGDNFDNSTIRNNVIGNISGDALSFIGSNQNNITIENNYIGLNAVGTLALPIGNYGIFYPNNNFDNAIIKNNIISNTGNSAIYFAGKNHSGNLIEGNYIGVDATGINGAANNIQGHGIQFGDDNSDLNTITNNIIGNTTGSGFKLKENTKGFSNGNVFQGNYFGVDITGKGAIPIGEYGIYVNSDRFSLNTIGGSGVGEGNIISNCGKSGLYFGPLHQYSANNYIEGNHIGTGIDGNEDMGNGEHGIEIASDVHATAFDNNFIICNIIAFNALDGVSINSTIAGKVSDDVAISRNSIYCNSGKGIDLNGVGNLNLPSSTITSVTGTVVTGSSTGTNGVVHIFMSDPGTCGGSQAQYYVGKVNRAASWTYDLALDGTATISALSGNISTIDVHGTGDASEISAFMFFQAFNASDIPTTCASPPVLLKIDFLDFKAKYNSIFDVVELNWATTNDDENKGFEIQKSNDGKHFEKIEWVNNKESNDNINAYFSKDYDVNNEILYYRLKQISEAGSYSYSKTIVVKTSKNNNIKMYPNPFSDVLTLNLSNHPKAIINILNAQSQLIKSFQVEKDELKTINTTDLPAGIYYIQVLSDSKVNMFKTIKTK